MKPKVNIAAGSYIRIKSQTTIGQVVRLNRQKVMVSIGSLLISLPIDKVEIADYETHYVTQKQNNKPSNSLITDPPSPIDPILDLHGCNTAQALFELEKFLDRALLSGHSQLKIIHGQGSGILRRVVRNYLRQHHLVKGIIEQSPIRCMAGITIAEI
ncbi:Smr/MutS family protein [Cardinium endosymbiont of Tipula unca]|uniref:Smr/MutS family protein n=1 Tax=Cardinium endosymbiont of Tipula unca TaxID=3066216 RepID=UPI0030CB6DAA